MVKRLERRVITRKEFTEQVEQLLTRGRGYDVMSEYWYVNSTTLNPSLQRD